MLIVMSLNRFYARFELTIRHAAHANTVSTFMRTIYTKDILLETLALL